MCHNVTWNLVGLNIEELLAERKKIDMCVLLLSHWRGGLAGRQPRVSQQRALRLVAFDLSSHWQSVCLRVTVLWVEQSMWCVIRSFESWLPRCKHHVCGFNKTRCFKDVQSHQKWKDERLACLQNKQAITKDMFLHRYQSKHSQEMDQRKKAWPSCKI